jgi:hypothetical protein
MAQCFRHQPTNHDRQTLNTSTDQDETAHRQNLEYICRHDITAIRRFIIIFVYISNLITRLIYEILQENRRNDN